MINDSDFPSPNDPIDLKQEILRCGNLFMSPKEVSTITRLSFAELDDFCVKNFHMSLSATLEWCHRKADSDVRTALQYLMNKGNNVATQIYTKYIDKIASDEQAQEAKVTIVMGVPKDE